jgi:DNA-binding MarR family transcriptional regulator
VQRDAYGWPRAESEAAFAAVGDRIIEAIRELRRLWPPLERSVYSVGGQPLTPTQVEALEALVTRGHWRMHEVAEKLGIDQSTATRTVAPLVERGLLDRTTDPLDARYVVVGLTAAGRRYCDAVAEARRQLLREVVGQMEPVRRRQFADLLEEYVRAHKGPAADAARQRRGAAANQEWEG